MANQTDMERYEKFIQKKQAEGENFTTRTRAFFKDMFLLRERRENDGLTLPPGVEERRREIDSLRRIEMRLEQVDENTSWLNKLLSGIFKSTAGEVEKKYPSRKKP
jgi:predicted RNA-binding protein